MVTDTSRALVDSFFRQEWRNTIARLTREFGPSRLEAIEAATQSALVKALDHWSVDAPPENPRAWVYRVARNALLDDMRKRATHLRLVDTVAEQLYPRQAGQHDGCDIEVDPLLDDVLNMLFVCSDPRIRSRDSVILTLRVISGFGFEDIASALLISYEAAKKSMTRCRAALKKSEIRFEQQESSQFESRLDRVLRIIYLIFNEGYFASSGDNLIRRELCVEADRLLDLLRRSKLSADNRVWALSALVNLQASRLPARLDADLNIVLLSNQDRSLWSRSLIESGFAYLDKSATGETISSYHLEAAIAACHARALSYDATDWNLIVNYYDSLAKMTGSPMVSLNRAVALMERDGADAAWPILKALHDGGALQYSPLLPAVMSECCLRQDDQQAARYWSKQAASLSRNRVLGEHWQEKSHAM